jgi:hypothetical protein
MTVKTIHGRVSKNKLKNGLNRLIDNWIMDGQKVLCHTTETSISARLIIIHDNVKLTLNFEEDK